MSHYPIAKDFRNIDVSMPYHKLLFPLAGPVLKLMAHCVPLLKGLTVSKRSVPGFQGKPFSVELYRPTDKTGNLPCVLLFHGGGFGYQAAPYHKRLAMAYAQQLGCVTVFPDYHLLPRYPYPAAKEDALAVYQWLHGQREDLHVDREKILVAGDSTGAVLATYVAEATLPGSSRPCGQLLIYPVTGEGQQTDSIRTFQDTPMWNSKNNRKMWKWYLKGANATQRVEASPMTAPLRAPLPPAYIETAEFDCLHDEALLYAQRLRDQGGQVTLWETKGTVHGYDFCWDSPITQDSVRRRVEAMREMLETAASPAKGI